MTDVTETLDKSMQEAVAEIRNGNKLTEADAVVARAVRDRQELVQNLQRAEDLARQWEAQFLKLQDDFERMQKDLVQAKSQRDFYLRYSTELYTRIGSCVNILQQAQVVDEVTPKPKA